MFTRYFPVTFILYVQLISWTAVRKDINVTLKVTLVNVTVTCGEVQGCRFASCHVFSVHIHHIDEFLHPRNVPVSTGFKQLPESPVCTAAAAATAASAAATAATAAARVTATRVRRRSGAGPATLGCSWGASAAASAAAAAGGEGQSWGGGGGRGRGYLTVSCVLHRASLGKRSGIVGESRRARRASRARGAARRGGQQGVRLLLLLRGATRRRHFHNTTGPH